MLWRLIIEEFGPTLTYIKGSSDALSRLQLTEAPKTPTTESSLFVKNNLLTYAPSTQSVSVMAELFGMDTVDLSTTAYPLQFKTIQASQQADSLLLWKKAKTDPITLTKSLVGEEQHNHLSVRTTKL
jgi:hypothetical protein